MQIAAEQFQELRDEAWRADHEHAMACRDAEDLIERAHALWDEQRQYLVSLVRQTMSREEGRQQAHSLRLAEQAMSAIMRLAATLIGKGYTVDQLPLLAGSLKEVRLMILLPIATRIAANSPDTSVMDVQRYLLQHARFCEGRPVITEEMAAELPSPYEPA